MKLSDMGITLDDATRRAIADSTIITPGCPKQLTADELYEILEECGWTTFRCFWSS